MPWSLRLKEWMTLCICAAHVAPRRAYAVQRFFRKCICGIAHWIGKNSVKTVPRVFVWKIDWSVLLKPWIARIKHYLRCWWCHCAAMLCALKSAESAPLFYAKFFKKWAARPVPWNVRFRKRQKEFFLCSMRFALRKLINIIKTVRGQRRSVPFINQHCVDSFWKNNLRNLFGKKYELRASQKVRAVEWSVPQVPRTLLLEAISVPSVPQSLCEKMICSSTQ